MIGRFILYIEIYITKIARNFRTEVERTFIMSLFFFWIHIGNMQRRGYILIYIDQGNRVRISNLEESVMSHFATAALFCTRNGTVRNSAHNL